MARKGLIKTGLALFLFCMMSQPCLAFELLLDPGHSPQKGGATSCTGESEYKYNDSLAQYIKSYLEGQGFNVALTRQPAEEMSLSARGAASAGKDLLISLHHDSVQPQFIKQENGFPQSDKAAGYSIFVSRKNPDFEASLKYARKLGQFLRQCKLEPSAHHGENIKGENRELLDADLGIYAFDDLVVLKSAKSPALLLEAGVIVNPVDEKIVRLDEYKRILAGAVEAAIAPDQKDVPKP